MRKWFLSLAALALLASPAFAGNFNKKVSVGDPAPTFSNIPAVENGKDATLSLDNLKDDIVVVVFLGNHCPVVVEYEDRIVDFANAYKDKGVRVVGLSVNNLESDKLPAIKVRMEGTGKGDPNAKGWHNYIYGYEESGKIGKAYGATNTPQFFVLDKTRTIRYMGALDDSRDENKVKKHYLSDAVDALLKGETIEIAETRPVGCGVKYKQ
jgi:peroxiredoxin